MIIYRQHVSTTWQLLRHTWLEREFQALTCEENKFTGRGEGAKKMRIYSSSTINGGVANREERLG